MNAPYSTLEHMAMRMYDAYCDAVGGKAYDGRPLPKAKDFFSDASKAKQAKGWFKAASEAATVLAELSGEYKSN